MTEIIDREYYEGCIEELRKALEEIDAVAVGKKAGAAKRMQAIARKALSHSKRSLSLKQELAMPTDPEVIQANFEADDGWRYVCRDCGKTPQDIGRCDKCGYNRVYEKVRSSNLQ